MHLHLGDPFSLFVPSALQLQQQQTLTVLFSFDCWLEDTGPVGLPGTVNGRRFSVMHGQRDILQCWFISTTKFSPKFPINPIFPPWSTTQAV
jgi:hypothetical protein